jgi:hypothetical protein
MNCASNFQCSSGPHFHKCSTRTWHSIGSWKFECCGDDVPRAAESHRTREPIFLDLNRHRLLNPVKCRVLRSRPNHIRKSSSVSLLLAGAHHNLKPILSCRDSGLRKWLSCTLNPFAIVWSRHIILETTFSISPFYLASAL